MTSGRAPVRGEIALSADERSHTQRMHDSLAEVISTAGGWISFERYMDIALYAAGLGYYSAGGHKLGEGGDFTTAPEISALFGACLARQCAEVLLTLRHGPAAQGGSILEIGAGSGRLAADILAHLEAQGMLPARYLILEISADLRERQRRLLTARIPQLLERIAWLIEPPIAPFDGVILANEVLDALPVARFRWHRTHCEELGVGLEQGRLVWAPRPASEGMSEVCRGLAAAGGGWDEGYESEYCPRLEDWTVHVTRALHTGVVLWIDYGLPRAHYYLRERRGGTLLCHIRHRAHGDPFLYPGLQDISAWVDFTALAHASRRAGCQLEGFATQAHFLAGLNIEREMQVLAGADENRFARLANEARRLMLPGEMGERFKVMAWTRGVRAPLRGFALQDLRHTL